MSTHSAQSSSEAIPLEAIDAACAAIHREKVESRIDANFVAYKALTAVRAAGFALVRVRPAPENTVPLPDVDSL